MKFSAILFLVSERNTEFKNMRDKKDMNKPYYFVQRRGMKDVEVTRFDVNHKGLEDAITFADSVDRDVMKLADNACGVEIVWLNPRGRNRMFETFDEEIAVWGKK
tara:strand:+ start:271 stop:585 length:315 start_codon:yes stop_codon:yes gene_type:complete